MKVQSHAIQAYSRTAINPSTPAQPVAETSADSSADEAAMVTLSPQARELAKGGVDHQKVSALREKLESGELKVNTQTLALTMLDMFA